MSKIIDASGKCVLKDYDELPFFTVINYLHKNKVHYALYNRLSELILTLDGDASMPFNTVGEMIEEIPEIVTCGEETRFLMAHNDGEFHWFIFKDYDFDESYETANKILQTFFPGYCVVKD